MDDTRPGAERLVGVDTGGTFTDVILRDADGRLHVHKLLSTPADPSEAIADGMAVVDERPADVAPPHLIHGTTVATNALLERVGARLAFVTTAGFEDLLFLRRQHRPELYRFDIELPAPLVDHDACFGGPERVDWDGRVLEPLGDDAVDELVDRIAEGGFEAVAICLLHSYANDAHEAKIAAALRDRLPELHVSSSSEVAREFREYERASTTCVNGFVGPVMSHYLSSLSSRVDARRIEILQSSGGRADVEHASRFPVHTVLSGPAGGVVGALSSAREIDFDQIIGFDMGGTSTDVSLCDGDVRLSTSAEIGGLPIMVPVIDIYTVGAGGGSIAYADPGGALRVGPRSAGADPGPACYGQGGQQPTVTDAHLYLGRLRADHFLGGRMSLDVAAAERAIEELAGTLELSPDECARGILEVADASMVRAIKVISLERGYDPRDFALVSFGGAGGLHACRLADAMDISRVIVPRNPGLLSAYGMLNAEAQRLHSRTLLVELAAVFDADDERAQVDEALEELVRVSVDELDASAEDVDVDVSVDLRYEGQSFEIEVPVDWQAGSDGWDDPTEAFERRHEELYGYQASGRAVELVTLRVRAALPAPEINPREVSVADEATEIGHKPTVDVVGFRGGDPETQIVARQALEEGARLDGPVVITEYSGTTVVPPGWRVDVRRGHLVVEKD